MRSENANIFYELWIICRIAKEFLKLPEFWNVALLTLKCLVEVEHIKQDILTSN